MPSTTITAPPNPPSHHAILSIPPNTNLTPALLRKYYHAALLTHHPDKTSSSQHASLNSTTARARAPSYTIDQIRTAYHSLSSPSSPSSLSPSAPSPKPLFTATPLESLDLDDFEFRAEGELGRRFVRGCRCGAEEGFIIPEELLEEVAEGGAGAGWCEVEVYCVGCSLRVRVGFVGLDEEEGGEGEE